MVGGESLLQGRGNLIVSIHSNSLYPKSVGKLHKIRVSEIGINITAEAELLVVSDNPIRIVVEQKDRDGKVVPDSSSKLLTGEEESSITTDSDNRATGAGNLCTDSGRKTITDRPGTHRPEKGARLIDREASTSPIGCDR